MRTPYVERLRNAWYSLSGGRVYKPHALVDAQITFDELKQYLQENPDANPWDLYKASFNRKTAIEYSTLSRCVSLISGLAANLITDAVYVVDR